jgi:tetratricopeptide (TPR) repeat protein
MPRFLLPAIALALLLASCSRTDPAQLLQDAMAAARENRLPQAEQLSRESLRAAPGNIDALILNSYCKLLSDERKTEREKALYNLQKATQLAPDHFAAHYFCGWAMLQNRQSLKAIRFLERAYELLPKDSPHRANLRLFLATCYIENNLQDEALRILQPLQRFKPYRDWPELYNCLGLLAIKRMQPKKAQFFFETGLRIAPDNETLLQNLAVTFDQYGNDPQKASLLYRKCQAAKFRRREFDETFKALERRTRQLAHRRR